MNEWISVEHRLPEEEGYYLTVMKDGKDPSSHLIQYFFKKTRSTDSICGIWTHWEKIEWSGAKVTHWMPLPGLPHE